jgi:hypothetical protein
MSPSAEDLYEGFEVVRCECGPNSRQKIKRDCPCCSHRCLICLHMRKHILAYDYMPIGPLLASLCRSKSICEKMLMTWKAKDRWLGKDFKFCQKLLKNILTVASFMSIKHFGILKGSGKPL